MNDHITSEPLKFEANDAHSANATFRVAYPHAIGNADTNQGVAKGDKLAGDKNEANNQFMALGPEYVQESVVGSELVFETQQDLNLISRSVASSRVAQNVGLSGVAQEAYAQTPDGKPVGVSAFVSGKPLLENVVDGDNQYVRNRDFDLAHPDTQRGMYDLQSMDYVMLQMDRHAGNITINEATHAVEAFDNDICLGTQSIEDAARDAAVAQKVVVRPPNIYHEDSAQKWEETSLKGHQAVLEGVHNGQGGNRLAPEEIAHSVEHLQDLKLEIQKARSIGRVVGEFTPEHFAEAVQQQQRLPMTKAGLREGTASYLGRAVDQLEDARKREQASLSKGETPVERVVQPEPPQPPSPAQKQLAEARAQLQAAKLEATGNPTPETKKATKALEKARRDLDKAREGVGKVLKKMPIAQEYAMRAEVQDMQVAVKALQFGQDETMKGPQAEAVSRLTGWERREDGCFYKPNGGDKLTGAEIREVRESLSQKADKMGKDLNDMDQMVRSAARKPMEKMEAAARKVEAAKAALEQALNQDVRVERAIKDLNQAQDGNQWATAQPAVNNTAGGGWTASKPATSVRDAVSGVKPGAARNQPKVADMDPAWAELLEKRGNLSRESRTRGLQAQNGVDHAVDAKPNEVGNRDLETKSELTIEDSGVDTKPISTREAAKIWKDREAAAKVEGNKVKGFTK